ncbi:hypothetical protein EYC80_006940 [Monilinia laxa]|uniref:Uncharacterized protein n=1 Tax=Monilinia laxa TaxID=61186 RepID=A0A5N6JZM8_MONLA|nr:hypothetical protein EYC80_006940 [Monilinia laxa]
MAKPQAAKGVSKVPNKALYSRMSYLYQAATYLAVQDNGNQNWSIKGGASDPSMEDVMQCDTKVDANFTGSCQPLSRRLISELRSVSQKGLMRMSPEMKHSMCKNCQTLLMEGTSCTALIENKTLEDFCREVALRDVPFRHAVASSKQITVAGQQYSFLICAVIQIQKADSITLSS